MENYEQYNELLQRPLLLWRGFLVAEVIIFLGLLIFCLKYKIKNGPILMVIIGFILALTIYLFLILPFQKDIEENAYTTYTGEFYVVGSYFSNASYIEIQFPDQEKSVRYHLLCDNSYIDDHTQYEGTLVYSTRTKCLVDIILP